MFILIYEYIYQTIDVNELRLSENGSIKNKFDDRNINKKNIISFIIKKHAKMERKNQFDEICEDDLTDNYVNNIRRDHEIFEYFEEKLIEKYNNKIDIEVF